LPSASNVWNSVFWPARVAESCRVFDSSLASSASRDEMVRDSAVSPRSAAPTCGAVSANAPEIASKLRASWAVSSWPTVVASPSNASVTS
jgi:hypothetical protein